MIATILWDWNGTLLDDTRAALDTLNIMLERRGKAPIEMDFYRDHFGFPVRPFYEYIGMELEHEDWDALAKEYHDLYLEQPKALNARAIEALELAREKGARQCIVSALRQDFLDADIAHYGVRPYIILAYGTDNLDGSSKLSRAKDLMGTLHSTTTTSNYNYNSHTCIIGDAFHDKEVADALGIRCILHGEGSHAPWRLRQRAIVADSLPDAVRLAFK